MANNSPKVKVCYAAPCTRLGHVAVGNTNGKTVMVCAPHAAVFKTTATAPAARA
jgi:hypothetical protein